LLVLTGGRDGGTRSLREQYDVLTGRAELPSGWHTASEYGDYLLWVINQVLPGRCFFVTSMGFFGVTVEKVRKNDNITFLFGEKVPIVLRSQDSSYTMVGAAYVSGVMNGELTCDMYQSGLIEKRTFHIR
jgi:hypothetical protein